jgi:molybdopterin/thiamine biosynthesis adenylyltransferase
MLEPEARVLAIGLGNIGSHLISHIGRMPEVGEVTLIDHDVYEDGNLVSQSITPSEIGRPKVLVQARRLRGIKAALRVQPIVDSVERLPLGRLRADVILACVDSRRTRLAISQAAWRVGAPLIDAGVDGAGLLARVNVYLPGGDGPCLECAYDEHDYAAIETVYPCTPRSDSNGRDKSRSAFSTAAPSTIGALAAALQAIECRKLLTGQFEQAAIGRQILIDARHHRHYLTAIPRNPNCRFDHEVWPITAIRGRASSITLGDAFKLDGAFDSVRGGIGIAVEGHVFVRQLTCRSCGWKKGVLRLDRSLWASERVCEGCLQETMFAAGFDQTERLEASTLPRRMLRRSLASIGLRDGDVFSLDGPSGRFHFEIEGDHP